jgi:hypothetical protein
VFIVYEDLLGVASMNSSSERAGMGYGASVSPPKHARLCTQDAEVAPTSGRIDRTTKQLAVIVSMAPLNHHEGPTEGQVSQGRPDREVHNDEPLFGLDCQESARDLFPFFWLC